MNFPVNKPEKRHRPSASPTHGIYCEMYERLRHDHDELRNSKKEIEDMYMPRLGPNLVTTGASSRLTRNLMMNLEESMKMLS